MKKMLVPTLLLLAYGCSSNVQNPNFPTDSELEEKVISRIDDLTSRPSWFKESEVFQVTDGKVISLGAAVIPGDHRVDAAIRIAQSNAKAGICSAIEQRLDYVFQNAQEGTALDSNQARFIGAEACKLTTSSMKNGKIYWEKITSKRDTGERFSQYKVFATVLMSEAELKAAIIEATKKRSGKGGLSVDFAEKVDKHWEQFTQAPTDATPVRELVQENQGLSKLEASTNVTNQEPKSKNK